MKNIRPAFADDEAAAVVAAMRDVAGTGATGGAVSDADRETIRAAWHWLYGMNGPLNLAFLPAMTPEGLAAAVPDADKRTWAAHTLAVVPFVDGKVDAAKAARVAGYCDALGIHEDFAGELKALAGGHLTAVLACMIRENVVSIENGPWPGDDSLAYFLPYRAKPDPDLAARHAALSRLAPETLGRQWHDWYKRNQFPFPGEADGLNITFAWPHDTTHLLSGYNSTPHGELLVSTFTAGVHPRNPIEGHILPVIFSWHLGIPLNRVAGSYVGAFDPELFWEAWERGARVTTDVFGPGWDFWAACERPLADLQREYGVVPSAFPWERTSA